MSPVMAVYDCCVHCDHDPDWASWHNDPCEDDRCPASQPLDPAASRSPIAPAPSDTCNHCLHHDEDGTWACCLCAPAAAS